MKTKIAKLIRIISLPAVLALALFSVMVTQQPPLLSSQDFCISLLFIVFLPLAAYPVSLLQKKKEISPREVQRSLAFVLTLVGHTLALAYGFIEDTSIELRIVYWTYFISILLLFLFNKLLHIRASAHAASAAGTLMLIPLFLGTVWLLPCAALAAIVAWASLSLKRHSIQELLFGAGCGIASFAFSLLITP